jgi:hypothetical protein
MVTPLAFCATAIATLFAQATVVRYSQGRKQHNRAWTIALALFALASAMLALGSSNGWDAPKFRAFFLFGAVLDVPWLALGTVYLLGPAKLARRVETGVWCFTGLAVGVLCSAPLHRAAITPSHIPDGKAVFGAWPRALAGVGSGVGATIVLVGAVWSAVRLLRHRDATPFAGRFAAANALIALGTIILGTTGTLKGVAGGKDEAFALGVAVGIAVIYAGFVLATPPRPPQPAVDTGESVAPAPRQSHDAPTPLPTRASAPVDTHAS